MKTHERIKLVKDTVFNAIAPLVNERDPVVVRKAILENLDALNAVCFNRVVLRESNGKTRRVWEPDVRTMVLVQKALSELMGVAQQADEWKRRAAEVETPIEQIRQALRRNGYEIMRIEGTHGSN